MYVLSKNMLNQLLLLTIVLAVISFIYSDLEKICNPLIESEIDKPPNEDAERKGIYEQVLKCYRNLEVSRERDSQNFTPIISISASVIASVDNWIDDIDAANIMYLTNCVKQYDSEKLQYRKIGDKYLINGNSVTFLNEIFQAVNPELFERIIGVSDEIALQMNWTPEPSVLGIRCIELLQYGLKEELTWHDDFGSMYTISILLSDKSVFEGGDFLIDTEGIEDEDVFSEDILLIPQSKYGGFMFDSHSYHSISPITYGVRTVLVLELWPFVDSSFNDWRPDITSKSYVDILRDEFALLPRFKSLFNTSVCKIN